MYFKILNDGVAVLTTGSQTTTDAYSYEAFGNIMSQAGTTVNPYKYVGTLGYYTDQTTKLYHVGARYYSPQVGRFWTQDPVKHPGVNAYPYVANNPVNEWDPTGRNPIVIACLASCGCVLAAFLGAVAGCYAGGCADVDVDGHSYCRDCVVDAILQTAAENPGWCLLVGGCMVRCAMCIGGLWVLSRHPPVPW